MKTISILLALINSLAAGLVLAAALPAIQITRPAASILNAGKVVLSLAIISAGILTWIAASRNTSPRLVFLVCLFLVSVGTASAVWTVHLALNGGHLKDHLFLYGGSLAVQGASALWSLLLGARNPSGI